MEHFILGESSASDVDDQLVWFIPHLESVFILIIVKKELAKVIDIPTFHIKSSFVFMNSSDSIFPTLSNPPCTWQSEIPSVYMSCPLNTFLVYSAHL